MTFNYKLNSGGLKKPEKPPKAALIAKSLGKKSATSQRVSNLQLLGVRKAPSLGLKNSATGAGIIAQSAGYGASSTCAVSEKLTHHKARDSFAKPTNYQTATSEDQSNDMATMKSTKNMTNIMNLSNYIERSNDNSFDFTSNRAPQLPPSGKFRRPMTKQSAKPTK